jgi:ribosomal protein L37AE/L43A
MSQTSTGASKPPGLRRRARAQSSRRDAPVVCEVCERRVVRRMRGQRYCSKRCRQKANYAEKVARGDFSTRTIARPTRPLKKSRQFSSLQWTKSRSRVAIVAPALVLEIEVFDRAWQVAVSSGGVHIEVSRVRPRALIEARHG